LTNNVQFASCHSGRAVTSPTRESGGGGVSCRACADHAAAQQAGSQSFDYCSNTGPPHNADKSNQKTAGMQEQRNAASARMVRCARAYKHTHAPRYVPSWRSPGLGRATAIQPSLAAPRRVVRPSVQGDGEGGAQDRSTHATTTHRGSTARRHTTNHHATIQTSAAQYHT
jgi:hypothetical protein